MGGFFLCKPQVGHFSVTTRSSCNISGRRQQKKSLKPIQKLATHPALRSLISLIRKMNGQINDKWSGRRKNTVQRNEENKKNTTGISLGYRSLKNN
jgi:hypothetical protein